MVHQFKHQVLAALEEKGVIVAHGVDLDPSLLQCYGVGAQFDNNFDKLPEFEKFIKQSAQKCVNEITKTTMTVTDLDFDLLVDDTCATINISYKTPLQ